MGGAGIDAGDLDAWLEPFLGAMGRKTRRGWAPLYAAHHPALPDQFVTRSTLEATDLGFVIDGILGHVLLRLGQVGGLPAPNEILWGSRFGHARRYTEPLPA